MTTAIDLTAIDSMTAREVRDACEQLFIEVRAHSEALGIPVRDEGDIWGQLRQSRRELQRAIDDFGKAAEPRRPRLRLIDGGLSEKATSGPAA